MAEPSGKIEPIRRYAPMPAQDRRGREGRVGPFVTFVQGVRSNGVVARWESRDHRKHLQGALTARLDLVGTRGPGMVDRCPVRGGVAAVRPRRGSRVRQRRRDPLGRGDVLRRLGVLHLGRVPDLPRGRRCRPAAAGCRPAALFRLPALPDRLVGDRGAAGRDCLLQHQHRERSAGGPDRAGRAPACVAARRLRLDLLPSGQPSPATSTRQPASYTTPSGRTWAPSSVRCASSPGRCCSCPNAPRTPVPQ